MFIRPSKWSFVTSGTGGFNIDILAASGGSIDLLDPAGKPQNFKSGSAGVGAGIGVKVPKIGKLEIRPEKLGHAIGGVLAPKTFPNAGSL